MGTDHVSETLDFITSLTRLTSREHFIDPKDCTVSQLARRQAIWTAPLWKLQLRHTLFSFQRKKENMFWSLC